MNNFVARTLAGAVFVAVLVAVALWGGWAGIYVLGALLTGLAWLEWSALTQPDKQLIHSWSFVGLLIALANFFATVIPGTTEGILFATALLWVFLGMFRKRRLNATLVEALGLLLIPVSFGLFARFQPPVILYMPDYRLALLVAIWSFDTFAYLGGRAYGRHKLAPTLSPGKTWEGAITGMAAAMAAGAAIAWFSGHQSYAFWIGLAVVVSVFGTLGDLAQSALKRQAGVKDSGALIPGHGGVLDRFDSLIGAMPFAWIYLQLLGERV